MPDAGSGYLFSLKMLLLCQKTHLKNIFSASEPVNIYEKVAGMSETPWSLKTEPNLNLKKN